MGKKLELENSSLIDQLALFENDLGLVQKAIKEEYKLVEDANLKRNKIELEVLQLQKLSEQIQNEQKSTKSMLSKTTKDLVDMIGHKNTQDTRLDHLNWLADSKKMKIEQLEHQLGFETEEAKKIQLKCDTMEAKCAESSILVKMCAERLDEIYRDLDARNLHSIKIKKHVEHLKNQILELNLESNAFKESINDEKKNLSKLNNQKSFISAQISTLEFEIKDLVKKELSNLREFESLQEKRVETEEALQNHQNEVKGLKNDFVELEKELSSLIAEKSALNKKCTNIMVSNSLCDKEVQKIRKDIENLMQDNTDIEFKKIKFSNNLARIKSKSILIESSICKYEEEIALRETENSESKNRADLSEKKIRDGNNLMQKCQKNIEQLNGKIYQIKLINGGVDSSPLEIEMNSLKRSIDRKNSDQRDFEREWLKTREQLVLDQERLAILKNECSDLAEKVEVKRNEESRKNRQLNEIMAKRRFFESKTEEMRRYLGRIGEIYSRECVCIEKAEEMTLKNEENFKNMLQESQEKVEIFENSIDKLRSEINSLSSENLEIETSLGTWCEKVETLREIKNSVANPEAREDIQQLNLRLHNLKCSGDEIKRKQEEIVLSLEKLAHCKSMNLFGIKREFGDISNVKSQKAVSNANLDFKINELRRKISQNIKEYEKVELIINERKNIENCQKSKICDSNNKCDNLVSQITSLQSSKDFLEGKRSANQCEIVVLQEKLRKYRDLGENSKNLDNLSNFENKESLKNSCLKYKEKIQDIISCKIGNYSSLVLSKNSFQLLDFARNF